MKTATVTFRAMRDYGFGRMIYVAEGWSYFSMKTMREAYPKGTRFKRVKATKRNRIFG